MIEILKFGSQAQMVIGPASFASFVPDANNGVIKTKSTKKIVTLFLIPFSPFLIAVFLPVVFSLRCTTPTVKNFFTIFLL